MVRSSAADLTALREQVFRRDSWRCVWPGCGYGTGAEMGDIVLLQLAHLHHRGMGGSREANTPENCVTLCRFHHDIFDGRDGSANTKRELAVMLRTVAGI